MCQSGPPTRHHCRCEKCLVHANGIVLLPSQKQIPLSAPRWEGQQRQCTEFCISFGLQFISNACFPLLVTRTLLSPSHCGLLLAASMLRLLR